MNKLFNKKTISNIIFVIAIVLLLYPPTREWGMRQLAFAPSIKNNKKAEFVKYYDWSLRGLNTKDINLDEFKGRIIFINFWATWCPPCRAEMPMIQKLYNDYRDKVTFIFVTNEDRETVETFFNERSFNLPAYNSLSTPPKIFLKTNSIPATYLLDKNGAILISKTGAADWNSSKVRNLLDDLLAK